MQITPEMVKAIADAAGKALEPADIDPKDIPGNVARLGSTRVAITALIIFFALVFEALRQYGIEISGTTQYTIYGALGGLGVTDMQRPLGQRVKPGQNGPASVDGALVSGVHLEPDPQSESRPPPPPPAPS